tara:strand:+ start:147 stop:611 length:465 start_codon:yes stop_codon:yes gene_type:complete
MAYDEVLNEDGTVGVEPLPYGEYPDRDTLWRLRDTVGGRAVSTAFLGIRHRDGLYETAVGVDDNWVLQRRYHTRAEAIKGHQTIVKRELRKVRHPHPRIFMAWDNGAFVNSEDPDFQSVLVRNTAEYGPPTTVEYRDKYEGPTLSQTTDNDGDK